MTEFNTKLVHGIDIDDNNTGAVIMPVYSATTYQFAKPNELPRWDYARSGNPTREFVEKQITELEGGYQGFAFSSGMAAIHAVFAIFRPGDHIIISNSIYGGTFRLVNEYLKEFDIEFTEVNIQDLAAITAAIKPNTKGIYFEVVDNPLLRVASVKQIAAIAKQHAITTIVDNTFLTPYLQQPLKLGANIVIHSATKYLNGHSDNTAGLVVVDSAALATKVYFTQNAIGGTLSPENANLLRRGIQTLSVRMDRHLANTHQLVEFFSHQSYVKKVHYPGLQNDASDQIANEELRDGGGVVTVTFADTVDVSAAIEKLKIFKLAVSLGSVESLVETPYNMSHAELPVAERLRLGITPQLVRFAVGIEDGHDLVADIEQAFTN